MKTTIKDNVARSDAITIFRYKIEDLEKRLALEHRAIKEEMAIPLGKDLGTMEPSKPEPDCERDVYSGAISSAYSRMMAQAKKEVQGEIESRHMDMEKKEADRKLRELSSGLEKKETELRLKKRELDKRDNSLLKKSQRYQGRTRPLLLFLVAVDTLLSGAALAAMGYPLITSYVLGLAIGIGIFFLAENLPEIIDKGKDPVQKRAIAVAVFSGLFVLFYVLGIFRSTMFQAVHDEIGPGIHPIYFACLNLFFSIIGALVVAFKGLSKAEKKTLDQWKLAKGETDRLEAEARTLREDMVRVREEQAASELARRQIMLYGRDLEQLIQRFYGESLKTFYSTNMIYRSDGKAPKFFGDDVPLLPSFSKEPNS